jgi:hypothetical protein
MIIKIKSRKRPSFKQLLEYITNNEKSLLQNKEKRSFIITHNLKGKRIKQWVEQFKTNETYRKIKRTDSVCLFHEILSWHGDDAKNITPEKIEAMTREYIKLRNPNGMYVAVPHFDKEHYHVHLCASGIEYRTGKSLRLSKTNLQKLKKNIQDYQVEKFPELSKSVVQHGKKEKSMMTDKEYQIKQRTGRMTDKEMVIDILNNCYKKAISKEEFFENLLGCGLKTYIRGRNISGIIFNERKFRLKRLGFTAERLQELEKYFEREKELSETRGKREKTLRRNR